MSNNNGLCPRCGKRRNRVRGISPDTELFTRRDIEQEIEHDTKIILECDSGCASGNPVSAQLYGVACESPSCYKTCCDPEHGCCEYDVSTRSDYWPGFAHPRWLTCEELYHKHA